MKKKYPIGRIGIIGSAWGFPWLCKCQTTNPTKPTPLLKLKPLPQEPWVITAVDYKGPIGRGRWYLHTQMYQYSRYPEVHMTKSTKLSQLKKVMTRCIRTPGRYGGAFQPKPQVGDLGIICCRTRHRGGSGEICCAYRNTPHSVTGQKPNKLMFNRVVATKLP